MFLSEPEWQAVLLSLKVSSLAVAARKYSDWK